MLNKGNQYFKILVLCHFISHIISISKNLYSLLFFFKRLLKFLRNRKVSYIFVTNWFHN